MPIKLDDLLLQESKAIITFHEFTDKNLIHVLFPRQIDAEVLNDLMAVQNSFGRGKESILDSSGLECRIWLNPCHNGKAIAQRVADCLRDDHKLKIKLQEWKAERGFEIVVESFV